ncbi:uncharacterized protein LY79DRAFT_551261 [Colletotrichum navitas]|uniref:Uncharacterized protein n=1 Tax=Colletotrichum navitas TaxID=681940 RepID=A0AAD8Q0K2_9PEZI|nr:uncharacterized protein LY79DRAFT_551261 [Colletotrichum navitas]KAK1593565.1 hypothetical protein LY79DRAFT_551261 [Colletotrichum navitas]
MMYPNWTRRPCSPLTCAKAWPSSWEWGESLNAHLVSASIFPRLVPRRCRVLAVGALPTALPGPPPIGNQTPGERNEQSEREKKKGTSCTPTWCICKRPLPIPRKEERKMKEKSRPGQERRTHQTSHCACGKSILESYPLPPLGIRDCSFPVTMPMIPPWHGSGWTS